MEYTTSDVTLSVPKKKEKEGENIVDNSLGFFGFKFLGRGTRWYRVD